MRFFSSFSLEGRHPVPFDAAQRGAPPSASVTNCHLGGHRLLDTVFMTYASNMLAVFKKHFVDIRQTADLGKTKEEVKIFSV